MKFVLVVVVLLACTMLITSRMRRDRLRRSDPMPSDGTTPVIQDVHAAIASGQKIRAVKIYREVTGTDLLTAKNAVDHIARGAARGGDGGW